jgi:hypothetical protein
MNTDQKREKTGSWASLLTLRLLTHGLHPSVRQLATGERLKKSPRLTAAAFPEVAVTRHENEWDFTGVRIAAQAMSRFRNLTWQSS